VWTSLLLSNRLKDPGAATRIGENIAGKRAITADTALRLSRFFGTSAERRLYENPKNPWTAIHYRFFGCALNIAQTKSIG
jgi:hypothetical protein